MKQRFGRILLTITLYLSPLLLAACGEANLPYFNFDPPGIDQASEPSIPEAKVEVEPTDAEPSPLPTSQINVEAAPSPTPVPASEVSASVELPNRLETTPSPQNEVGEEPQTNIFDGGIRHWIYPSIRLKSPARDRIAAYLKSRNTPSLPTGTQVWVETATVKVRPSATQKTTLEARISAAKNEFEAFQIVLKSNLGIQGIRAEASSLIGPNGSVIPSSAIRFYQVGLMTIVSPSDQEGEVGAWPDPLIPAIDDLDQSARAGFPFDAAANEARAIWAELLVPSNAAAGTYQGQITLRGQGIEGYQIPVHLRVYDFMLPSTPTLQSYYQLNDLAVCSGHYQGDPSCGDWGNQKMALIDQYVRFALDHRLTLGNIYYQRPEGNDWSEFDRRYAPLLDGSAATRLAGAKLTSANYMLPLDPSSLASYQEHFVRKGWIERAFDYTADEPGYGSSWSSILPRAELVHAHAPRLKTLVTTTIDEAKSHGLADDIDIIVPIVNFIEAPAGHEYAGNQKSNYDIYRERGDTVWMYQSCMSHDCGGAGAVGDGTPSTGYPSLMIDHSALRNRAMEWVAFNFGATGDLYWETSFAYQEDAWSSQYAFTGNGDGTLFYPGTPARVGGTGNTPIASQRLKMLRDGIEDYEYLAMLSRLGDPNFAHTQSRLVAPTAYGIGSDPSQLEASRELIAQRIEELSGARTTSSQP